VECRGRDGHNMGWLKSVLLEDCKPSGLLESLTTQSASFNIPAKQQARGQRRHLFMRSKLTGCYYTGRIFLSRRRDPSVDTAGRDDTPTHTHIRVRRRRRAARCADEIPVSAQYTSLKMPRDFVVHLQPPCWNYAIQNFSLHYHTRHNFKPRQP